MKKYIVIVAIIIILFFNINVIRLFSNDLKRGVACFDLSEHNSESHSKIFSVQHALKVAGMVFITTKNVKKATEFSMIIISSRIYNTTLSIQEEEALINYVFNGGVLVAPKLSDKDLYNLFGISGYQSFSNHNRLIWNLDCPDTPFYWFEDSLEQKISLGRVDKAETFSTFSFSTENASPLAWYDDGEIAITKNKYGDGYTYLVGFSFKDVILRNQLNLDASAQRTYSNDFEPTSDVIFLFIRSIFENHTPFATRKHTSPDTSRASLIITHDVDCKSAVLMMNIFADL